jgi:SOS-response transcriptional repressor LexA
VTAGLTSRQRDLLRYIEHSVNIRGFAPSYSEMAVFLGMKSKSSAHKLVAALRERGAITHLPHQARSVALPDRGYRVILDQATDALMRRRAARARLPVERLIAVAADAYLQLVPDDQPGHRAEAEEWR